MKAIIPKLESQDDKDLRDNAEHVMQVTVAIVLYAMYTFWRCGAETCRKRFEQLMSIINAPAIFGRQINDYEVVEWCKRVLNIDVSEIKIKTKIKRI